MSGKESHLSEDLARFAERLRSEREQLSHELSHDPSHAELSHDLSHDLSRVYLRDPLAMLDRVINDIHLLQSGQLSPQHPILLDDRFPFLPCRCSDVSSSWHYSLGRRPGSDLNIL